MSLPKAQNEAILKAFDCINQNASSVNTTLGHVSTNADNIKLLTIKTLALEKQIEKMQKIMARYQMTEGNNEPSS